MQPHERTCLANKELANDNKDEKKPTCHCLHLVMKSENHIPIDSKILTTAIKTDEVN